MQASFPGQQVEGGGYTPSANVQYALRGIRATQAAGVGFYFFGEALFGSLGLRPPLLLAQIEANKMLAAASLYALHVLAQTLKSINAFEVTPTTPAPPPPCCCCPGGKCCLCCSELQVTYNGKLLHSKLATGAFPDAAELVRRLGEIKQLEQRSAVRADS